MPRDDANTGYETLLLDVSDGVGTLTLNRPKALNALTPQMKEEMADAVTRLEFDDAVRCVVVKGAGDHFMAGGDLKGFYADRENTAHAKRRRFLEGINALHPVMFSMRRMPKPVISSVQGYAAGFGLSLAMACDLTICADDAKFALAYVRIGTSPDGTASYMLPRIVGLKKAMEMAMLGDDWDAETAQRFGLTNFVVPRTDLTAETAKLATRLANGPTHALGGIKRLIHHSIDTAYEAQLQQEAETFASNVNGHDFLEGISAFVEKRKAKFVGK
ncbi:MAG: enoyl-CoA hydratase [Alphaproteobacteria bacterium]